MACDLFSNKVLQLLDTAQLDLITDNTAEKELPAARQNVSPGVNTKRKHSISTYENNNSQHDQSNTKKAKLL